MTWANAKETKALRRMVAARRKEWRVIEDDCRARRLNATLAIGAGVAYGNVLRELDRLSKGRTQ